MEQELMMPRKKEDRRRASRTAPPYLTEEGMVLFDRREVSDRRRATLASAPSAGSAVSKQPDLVRERLQRLMDLYGYQDVAEQAA